MSINNFNKWDNWETFLEREEKILSSPQLYFDDKYKKNSEKELLELNKKWSLLKSNNLKSYLWDLIIAIWIIENQTEDIWQLQSDIKFLEEINIDLSIKDANNKLKSEELNKQVSIYVDDILENWKIIEQKVTNYLKIIRDLEKQLQEEKLNFELIFESKLDLSKQNEWLKKRIRFLNKNRDKLIKEELTKKILEILSKNNKEYKEKLEIKIEEKFSKEFNQKLVNSTSKYEDIILSFKKEVSILEKQIQDLKNQLDKQQSDKLAVQLDKTKETISLMEKYFKVTDSEEYKKLEEEKNNFIKSLEKLELEVIKKDEIISSRDKTISQRDKEIEKLEKELEKIKKEKNKLHKIVISTKYWDN